MQVMPKASVAARSQSRQSRISAQVPRGRNGSTISAPMANRDHATKTGATPIPEVKILPALSPAGISDMAINMIGIARCITSG